jgi:hypothetical protein
LQRTALQFHSSFFLRLEPGTREVAGLFCARAVHNATLLCSFPF